jgi:hypothetical protein
MTGHAAVPGSPLRSFYALDLPHDGLAITLFIAALGAAGLVIFWAMVGRHGRGRSGG